MPWDHFSASVRSLCSLTLLPSQPPFENLKLGNQITQFQGGERATHSSWRPSLDRARALEAGGTEALKISARKIQTRTPNPTKIQKETTPATKPRRAQGRQDEEQWKGHETNLETSLATVTQPQTPPIQPTIYLSKQDSGTHIRN